jgi:simple sugar transport system permease protein
MAAVSPIMNTPEQSVERVPRLQITRTLIFSIVFVVAGLLMLMLSARQIDGSAASTLTFGQGISPLAVPTVAYATAIGLVYVASGALGLIPISRFAPWKAAALLVSGVLIIPTVLILASAGKETNLITMLASSFRAATPIVIGALAGIWCERAGVVNIGIEGMMLTGACFGFLAFSYTADAVPGQGGLYLGVMAAVISGGVMALLHAWLCITFKTDQIISGTVINILAAGLTSFLRLELLVNSDAARETLRPAYILFEEVPLLGDIMRWLADLPILGDVLFQGKPIFLMMFVLIVVTHVMLYYTRWGLRTRAVGENPHAADTLGINVNRNRYINVIIGGLIAGLAGAWFSLETTGTFSESMTSGTGFIALAAMIFGKWTPFGAAAGGVLFGFASALDTRFQILEVPIPSQFVQMTPYLVTIIVLAGLVGRATAPKAVGTPYEKE